MNRESVVVVSVTYGARFAFVEKMVSAVTAQGIQRVVVIDNASTGEDADRLLDWSEHTEGATLVRHAENEGSAGGFAKGIETAFADESVEAVWLLDDDNVPREGALDALVDEALRFPSAALAATREDRRYLWEVAHGVDPVVAYPPRSSFLGFRASDLFAKVRRHLGSRSSDALGPPRAQSVAIPFGPYGGLLLPRRVFEVIGSPDRAFHLYADDNDYTARIGRAGLELRLVPRAIVDDIDESWNATSKANTSIDRLLDMEDPRRLRFAVRNQVVFERRHWTDDATAYARNRRVYGWVLSLAARTTLRRRNLDVIRGAIDEADRIVSGQ